jgi:subtilisin family serine protease
MRAQTPRVVVVLSVVAILLTATSLIAKTTLSVESPVGSAKLWVFFTDKALSHGSEAAAIADFETALTERALERRAKVGIRVNINDLPVAGEYVDAVAATGVEIVARSRWLNAVSVRADLNEAEAIAALPFVREIRPVAKGTKPLPVIIPATDETRGQYGTRTFNYGDSYCQNDQVQIIDLHDDGFDGSGVIIAMLDTGFDTDHQAYRHLDIIGERDFINDDAVTSNQPGDPDGQDSHGTATLSNVGGMYAGEIYGGSYNAGFILCKTEMLEEEIEAEEDNWVEAVEYADSLGADVVSSSLGYLDWYTYADMDGNTCTTTVAADMAAARGIVIVNSMGNEGGNPWLYMIAPADGDSVLSIGAVDCDNYRVGFSSVGPTYDGRIKPDVMALGLYAYVATTEDTCSYGFASGTSFSCPITAGAVGLLIQGHPEWTPQDVIDAVHSTATQSASPDTLMGWGILQVSDAMYSEPLDVPDDDVIGGAALVWSAPNPFSPGTVLTYHVPSTSHVRASRAHAPGFRAGGRHVHGALGWPRQSRNESSERCLFLQI